MAIKNKPKRRASDAAAAAPPFGALSAVRPRVDEEPEPVTTSLFLLKHYSSQKSLGVKTRSLFSQIRRLLLFVFAVDFLPFLRFLVLQNRKFSR